MTDEEIIAVAEATGLKLITLGLDKQKSEFLILAFAKQIAKLERYHEREACAKLCEARAKDFLALYTRYQDEQDNGAEIAATQCARYIRARGEQE